MLGRNGMRRGDIRVGWEWERDRVAGLWDCDFDIVIVEFLEAGRSAKHVSDQPAIVNTGCSRRL
jgi:hypothetical protein